MVFLFLVFLTFIGIGGGASREVSGVLYIVGQMLLDTATMLTGNVTLITVSTGNVTTSVIVWLGTLPVMFTDLAGVLIDTEGILEKVIDLLLS